MAKFFSKWLIWKHDNIILILFAAAFFIRVYYSTSLIFYPDSVLYLSQAKAFLKGDFVFTFMGGIPKVLQPLFPLLAALFSLFCPTLEIAGSAVSVISGSLLVIPVYYLAKNIYGKYEACIAAFLVTFDPLLINFSIISMSEALFTFTILIAFIIFWRQLQNKRLLYAFFTGFLIGLAYLTRVIGIVFLLPIITWMIILTPRKDILKNIALRLLSLFFGFLITTVPYLFLLHNTFGQWVLTGFYGNVLDLIQQKPASNITQTPIHGLFDKLFISANSYGYIFFSTISLILLISIFLSLFKKWNKAELLKSGYLFSLIGFFLLFSIMFPPSTHDNFIRYLVPIFPVLFILSANGVVVIQKYITIYSKKRFPNSDKLIKSIYYILMILVLTVSLIQEYQRMEWFSLLHRSAFLKPEEYFPKQVGDMIKRRLPSSPKIIARKPLEAYYADATWYPISGATTYQDLLKIAESGGDYLYLDATANRLAPNISYLLNPQSASDIFTPILWNKNNKTGQYNVILYRISSKAAH